VEAGGEGEAGGLAALAPAVRRREPPRRREAGDDVRAPAEEEGVVGRPGRRLGHARVPPRRAAAQERE